MIYEFLYINKPTNPLIMIINISAVIIFIGFFLFFYYSERPLKEKDRTFTTYTYDPNLHKHIAISTTTAMPQPRSKDNITGITLSLLFIFLFSAVSAIHVYDYTTAPNKNTKTTELYQITKENDYLTFTAKKPYHHLYNTKTIKITYEDSENYVIINNEQSYKITKKDITEK